MRAAAERLLNYATYYQMKERAGLVGRTGAYAVISAIQARHPEVNVHLVGHSFGGRLVTAAARSRRRAPDSPLDHDAASSRLLALRIRGEL